MSYFASVQGRGTKGRLRAWYSGLLSLPSAIPGPGLGIRIIGDVTADKVRIVQDADAIYREEVDGAAQEVQERAWQGRAVDAEPVFCGIDQYAFCRCHG